MTVEPDYLISLETLTKLGNGDPKAGRRLLRTMIDLEITHEPINGPTERPTNVRAAVETDEADLVKLLRLDHAENAAHVAPFSEKDTLDFIQLGTREKRATIGVVDGPEGVIGLVYLIPDHWWYSSEHWYIAERLTFVEPSHRSSRMVGDLLRFARSFVDQMSEQLGYRVYLIGSVVATKDARRKTAVFGRLMNFAGGIYIYPDPTP